MKSCALNRDLTADLIVSGSAEHFAAPSSSDRATTQTAWERSGKRKARAREIEVIPGNLRAIR